MNRIGTLGRGLVLAAAAFVGSVTAASAAPMLFTLEGEDYSELGASVLFTYTGLSNTSGRIDVQLTNTSTAYDPRLTSFAFNLPGSPSVTNVTAFTSSIAGWVGYYDRNDIDTPGRYGFYDLAGLSGSSFSGGFPNEGIARNVTGNFSFTLAGNGLLGLTESSFLNLLSYDPSGRPYEDEQYFIGRFQRVGRHGNDSDVALPDGRPTTHSVPEPTALLLSGLGLLGAAAMSRRQRAH